MIDRDPVPALVVGIGSSAGGLQALEKLLTNFPRRDDPAEAVALVVVQHLDPDHESLLPEILGRATELEVVAARDRHPLRANHVYVIQPGTQISLVDHELRVERQPTRRSVSEGVDHFFKSLAEVFGERCAGVVLSGTGRDGTNGLRRIKAGGGITIAQEPADAGHSAMPRSAVDAGVADLVLSVEDMPDALAAYASRLTNGKRAQVDLGGEEALHEVAAVLRSHEDFDLSKYKSGTVERRIRRRIGLAGLDGLGSYLEFLRDDAEERRGLIRDMMIGVTDFFRDPEAFETLATEVLPGLVEAKRRSGEPLRLWCAGCASGEEAYSLAMLAYEACRTDGGEVDFHVFATDVDENALAIARAGVYPDTIRGFVSDHRLRQFFDTVDDNGYRVKPFIRNALSFAIHDITVDPPFSQLDLISCRNLLIYLRRELQKEVFETFHFALRPHGHLFLGGSETTGDSSSLFQAVSKRHRLFRRLNGRRVTPMLRTSRGVRRIPGTAADPEGAPPRRRAEPVIEEARQLLIEAWVPPTVVVDAAGAVLFVHGEVGTFLRIPSGEPRFELMAMLEPGLRTRVRAALYKSRRDGQAVVVEAGTPTREGGARTRISVRPSPVDGRELSAISFEQVVGSESPLPNVEAEHDQLVDQLEKELDATREDLRNTVEELETSNEELRAANEESTSINEELQSTNEELEATTEELRSLNEELTTVNAQLKVKVDQVQEAHDDLQNFFASTQLATLFLDEGLRIKRFTPAARRLLRLQDGDRRRYVDDLNRELLNRELEADARQVLESLTPAVTQLQLEDGRHFERRVLPYRSTANRIEGVVITFIDTTETRQLARSLERRERQAAAVAQLGLIGLTELALEDLFEQAVRGVQQVLGTDAVLVAMADDDALQVCAATGVDVGSGDRLSLGVGSLEGATLVHKGPVVSSPLADDSRFEVAPPLRAMSSGMGSVIGEVARPLGVVSVYSEQPREFSRDDANFLVAIANVLAATMRRRDVERSLEEGRRNFALALQHSPTVFYQCDADLRYTWVGKPHPLFPPGDLIGKRDDEVLSPDRAALVMGMKRRVLETGEGLREQHVAVLEHGEEHYDVTIEPIRDEDGSVSGLTIAAHDITPQVEMRQRLEAKRAQLAAQAMELGALYQSVPAGIAVLGDHGELLKVNPAFRSLMGLAEDQDPSAVELPPELRKVLREVVGTSAAVEGELTVGANGTRQHWSYGAVPQARDGAERTTLVIRDLTQRREVEERLRLSEARFRSVFDQAAIGIAIVDDSGRVTSANQRMAEILDRGDQGIVENSEFLDWVVPAARERARRSIAQAAADGTSFAAELEMMRSHGGVVWVKMTTSAFAPHTEGDAVVVVVEDISERKRSEMALQEAAEHKDDFLAMLGHELRNPLAALRYSTDLLGTLVSGEERLQRIQQIFDRQVTQMSRLVGDLLDVSRIARGKLSLQRETVDLGVLVAEVCEDAAPLFQRGDMGLRVDLPEHPAWVFGDGARLAQVVDNLVVNARKFTEAPGEVRVSLTRQDDEWVLRVQDTGVGMEQALIDRIFEPFRQLEGSREKAEGGLGLGLSIVRGVVDLHGGQVGAESDGAGHGSTFWVRVPAASPAVVPSSKPPRSAEQTRSRVLLIDDHRDALETLKLILEGAGHEVRTAFDGRTGLERIESFEPDIVFCDIGLPGGMSGYDVVRAVREDPDAEVAMVAITGFGRREDRVRAREAGFDEHMTKPVSTSELLAMVRRLRPSARH